MRFSVRDAGINRDLQIYENDRIMYIYFLFQQPFLKNLGFSVFLVNDTIEMGKKPLP